MISLILMCGFLAIAVFGRIFIHYLKTGDTGVRPAPTNSPMIEILPGAIFIMTFCFALTLVIIRYLNSVNLTIHLTSHLEYVGFIIGFSGIAITALSQFQMGNSWRIGVRQNEQTALVTNGLYAKSRNPIYFGVLLFWIGLSITFTHPLIWLSATICWVCIELIVRKIEEPYLRKEHGVVFDKYVKNTNRYLLL